MRNQKTIQTILFIFFLFSSNLVKSEEPKLKIVKVKEFNSYEEYEQWKGKVKKPGRIVVDKGIVKFCDEKGKVIREKKYRYMSKEDSLNIVDKEIKNGRSEKDISIYYEEVKLLPNEKGVLLEKITSYYEGGKLTYEIYDEYGDKIGEINENVEVYLSPDGEYFVGIYSTGLYDMFGEIAIFSKTGKLLKRIKVFDFTGMERNVIFSPNGEYVIFTLNEGTKSGLAFLNKNGEILKIKMSENWICPLGKRFIINKNEWIIFLSENDGKTNIESYSFKGELRWKYVIGRNIDIKYSFDGRDMLTVIEHPLTRIGEMPISFTLHFIDVNNGTLKGKRTFFNSYLGDPVDLCTSVKNNFILLTSNKVIHLDKKVISMIHLINKDGEIIWPKESKYTDSLEAEFDEEGRIVVKEKDKVFLYEVKQ